MNRVEKIRLSLKKLLICNCEVFVFGSFLRSAEPKDIDLLVIYENNLLKNLKINNLKFELAYIVEQDFGIKADILFLSEQEAYKEDLISNFPRLIQLY